MIKVLKNEKEKLEIGIDNLTIAELLRNELWKDDKVSVAAWKREHPTKNPVLIVHTKGESAKKALLDCIERTQKITDNIASEFKKAVKK